MTDLPASRFLDRSTPPRIVTLVLLASMAALSMNIFLPALPVMAQWFGVPYAMMQLSVVLYLGISAVLQVVIGPISDRFGRRKVVLGAMALFVLATAGTLLATTATQFLICRMAQAVVAAGLVLSRAVVRDMVPEAQAASMIGYVTMGMALVPMVGPMLGGVLSDAFGWHAIFWLLLGAGASTFALVWADLGETATLRGVTFAAQLRAYPLLLTSRRFWGYSLCSTFGSGAFFAYLGGAPFVGTEVFHLTSAQVGAYFGAPALGYAFGNFASGRYSVRLGVNRMALAGALITCTGLLVLAGLTLAGQHHATLFFGLIVSVGLGNGMVLPNATAGMLSVRPDLAGTASGLGGAITIGGGAALAALAGRLLVPGSGEMPLILLMLGSSLASLVAILAVIRRARTLGISA